MTPRGRSFLALAVLAGLVGLEAWRLGNPAPAPDGAPGDQFSASRAIATLQAVSVDAPHPVGTAAHDRVRDQVAAALRQLDYTVDIQHAFACNANADCAPIDNVIARRADQPAGKAVVVAAHYDSVPAGPGASDDGTGVATALEIARAIRHEQLARPVVFLIDDGEEAGLLGAEAFVADRARSQDAAFIVNLEARGTSGTPFLFETSREQRWLVPVVASALPRPATSSLFATIYDQLPNDTDLTVFKRDHRAGINFAYLGDGTQYHTPLDSFADVDPGSVQRRGDQALAMVRAFAGTDLAAATAAPEGAVWFDAFCAFVVWWPASWTVWIAALALVLCVVAVVRGARAGRLGIGGVALGVVSFAVAVAAAVALGLALGRLLGMRSPAALFAPHPAPEVGAAWLVGLAAAIGAAGAARRWASFDAVFAGHALAWSGLGLAAALLMPGASYLLVVPGLVMAGLAAVLGGRPAGEPVAALGGLLAAAVVCLPFALVGYDALAGGSTLVGSVLFAQIGTAFAPLLSGTAKRLTLGCLALAAVLGIASAIVPRESPSHPRQLPLAYVLDADGGRARWQASEPTPAVRRAAAFAADPVAVVPWRGPQVTASVATAPIEALAAPTAAVTTTPGDGTRTVAIDLVSMRGAPRLVLAWHSDAETVAVRVNGVALPPRPERWRDRLVPGWHRIGVAANAAHIELTVRGDAPAEATLRDISFGLPASGAALIQARDASGAVSVHEGDVTIVEHRLHW